MYYVHNVVRPVKGKRGMLRTRVSRFVERWREVLFGVSFVYVARAVCSYVPQMLCTLANARRRLYTSIVRSLRPLTRRSNHDHQLLNICGLAWRSWGTALCKITSEATDFSKHKCRNSDTLYTHSIRVLKWWRRFFQYAQRQLNDIDWFLRVPSQKATQYNYYYEAIRKLVS